MTTAGAGQLKSAALPDGPRAALGRLGGWEIATGYAGTAVETVGLGQVEQVSTTIAGWLRGEAGQ